MSAKTNDPKDPTTWTPGMVAAFNAIHPAEATRATMALRVAESRRRAVAEHAALEAVLAAAKRIGPGHTPACATSRAEVWNRKAPCTCGLDALRDAVATMEGSR